MIRFLKRTPPVVEPPPPPAPSRSPVEEIAYRHGDVYGAQAALVAIDAPLTIIDGGMHHGHAVQCNPNGSQRIVVNGAMNHVTAVCLFEADGQEWLAMTGLMTQAMPASPDDFTARLAIAPLAEILGAAE